VHVSGDARAGTLQAIQLRQERLFGEILIRKHVGFDALMNEQTAVRDDWK